MNVSAIPDPRSVEYQRLVEKIVGLYDIGFSVGQIKAVMPSTGFKFITDSITDNRSWSYKGVEAHRQDLPQNTSQTALIKLMAFADQLELPVDAFPLGLPTKKKMKRAGIGNVHSLLRWTEGELLVAAGLSSYQVRNTRKFLYNLGLYPGVFADQGSDNSSLIERELDASIAKALELTQVKGGVNFQRDGVYFSIRSDTEPSDMDAALLPFNAQLQHAIQRKAQSLFEAVSRLHNSHAWRELPEAAKNIRDLVDRSAKDIPNVLGPLYAASLEIASFIELDQRISSDKDSMSEPLDPEVGRPLMDLMRTIAPWLRAFPTIREADDQANSFLLRAEKLASTSAVMKLARDTSIVRQQDAELIDRLILAYERGAAQGQKAGVRSNRSVANLLITITAFAAGVLGQSVAGKIESDSILVEKISTFYIAGESAIFDIIDDLSEDMRYAIKSVLDGISQVKRADYDGDGDGDGELQ